MFRPVSMSAGFVALATALALPMAAPPVTARASSTVDAAVAFVAGEQRADGGFGAGESGFPGFETPDAVLAIAAGSQTGSSWIATDALAAVQAVSTSGKTGLSYLDDFADGGYWALSAGNAARLVLVATALGLDPSSFDPQGDGAVDLVATVQAGLLPDGSFGAGVMNTTLTAMLAYRAAGMPAPAGSLAYVEGAQQANGSWDYAGDASGSESDPDTTGLALVALVASGRIDADASVEDGLAFLAKSQNGDGTWSEAFGGESNPSSTALAILGLRALGFDPAESCWRDLALPDATASSYSSPVDALIDLQEADGHLASPFDQWGLNTLGTAQGVQALADGYVPFVVADPPECPIAVTTTTQPATTTTDDVTTTTSDPIDTAASTSTSFVATTASSSTSTTTSTSTSSTGYWSASGGSLPRTGGDAGGLLAVAVALLGAGATSLLVSSLRGPGRRAVGRVAR